MYTTTSYWTKRTFFYRVNFSDQESRLYRGERETFGEEYYCII